VEPRTFHFVIYALAWKLFKAKLARSRRRHWTYQELMALQLACLEEALDGQQEATPA